MGGTLACGRRARLPEQVLHVSFLGGTDKGTTAFKFRSQGHPLGLGRVGAPGVAIPLPASQGTGPATRDKRSRSPQPSYHWERSTRRPRHTAVTPESPSRGTNPCASRRPRAQRLRVLPQWLPHLFLRTTPGKLRLVSTSESGGWGRRSYLEGAARPTRKVESTPGTLTVEDKALVKGQGGEGFGIGAGPSPGPRARVRRAAPSGGAGRAYLEMRV